VTPTSNSFCIDGGIVIDDKTLESCEFPGNICADLPRCDNLCRTENPCRCLASDPRASLSCSPVHPPAGYAYAYDFQVSFFWGCRSVAQVVVYSDCGDFGTITPNFIADGFNNITGTFYTNQPPGTVCDFLVLLIDPETGLEICHFCVRLDLNCPRGFTDKNNITAIAGRQATEIPQTVVEVKSKVAAIAGKAAIKSNENIQLNNALVMLPNPASGFTRLAYKFKNDGNNSIVIYNMVGKPVKSFAGLTKSGILNIDVSIFAAGTYIVKGFGKEEILIGKLVVLH
jgi:hypothetical protein